MDIDVYNFVKKAISGGLSNSINPYEKLENDNQSIIMMDIASQYPCETAKEIPIGKYRFVQRFDENGYGQDKDFGCMLLCNVKTTDKIKNDFIQRQIPMLYSRIKITDENLSEYQLNQIREKRGRKEKEKIEYRTQTEKLISHLGNDKNNYMSFEMYKMMKEAGYDIKIKAILEYRYKAVFKGYVESLYEKKKKYGLEGKSAMKFCIKISLNSHCGSMLTNQQKFRNIKICSNTEELLKLTKRPEFSSFNIINENLIIVELNKTKCIYDNPILIAANILFGSKCNLYNYLYNINLNFFGKENIKYLIQDTDSLMMRIDNSSYEKYLKILKDNPQYFSSDLGKMENEIYENIQEVISLASKYYSLKLKKEDRRKVKGIPKNYSRQFHNHEIFRKAL